MLTKTQKNVKLLNLTFKGAINSYTASNIEFLVRRKIFGNRTANTIVFDFKDVTSIDKKGAEHLRNIADFVQKLDQKVHIINLSTVNQTLLRLEKVDGCYEIQKNLQEILPNTKITTQSNHIIDGSLGKRRGLMN